MLGRQLLEIKTKLECLQVADTGALKMRDRKMRDWKIREGEKYGTPGVA